MKILRIVRETAADGPGLRNSLYVAGCNHQCMGCHNPQSWDFSSGLNKTPRELADALCLGNSYNITISGGDPIYQSSELTDLCRLIKTEYKRNIWVYTGFLKEEVDQICPDLYQYIDVLVDGPFDKKLRDSLTSEERNNLRFIGSPNQSIIYLNTTSK